VREVGSYGVNIAFSDGHDRGIYPWSYLAQLSEKPKLEDFLYE
jgi:prepilin-type processing-associated H-X9-DG protein